MGRKKANIPWDKVDKYLQAQCNGTGIAAILGIHPDTLYLRCEAEKKMGFSEYSSLKKAEGKELLRAKQFQTAMSGNTTMMVFLGKNYLEQRDKPEPEPTNESFEFDITIRKRVEEKDPD